MEVEDTRKGDGNAPPPDVVERATRWMAEKGWIRRGERPSRSHPVQELVKQQANPITKTKAAPLAPPLSTAADVATALKAALARIREEQLLEAGPLLLRLRSTVASGAPAAAASAGAALVEIAAATPHGVSGLLERYEEAQTAVDLLAQDNVT